MRKVLIAVALFVTAAACNSAPSPPPFKPIAETKDLMELVFERQADIVWTATGTIISEAGIEERRPKTEEEWTAVKAAAVNLVEAGNLLMLPPRAQDGERWMLNVQQMMAQGEKMIAAIDRKDTTAMFDVGSDLYDTCTNCHMHYMPEIKDLYR